MGSGPDVVWSLEERLEVLENLVEWLTEGKTLRAFCRQKGNPSKSRIYAWIDEMGEAVAGRVAGARARGYETIAEEAMAIADDSSGDTSVDEDGNPTCNAEFVARAKLRVWCRLQLLRCWDPNRYGDKLQVAQTGTVKVMVVTGVPEPDAKPQLPAPTAERLTNGHA